jgi:hypothetical protein
MLWEVGGCNTKSSSANLPTVGVDLDAKSLDIVRSIRTSSEVR